jgi:hypothetical protein
MPKLIYAILSNAEYETAAGRVYWDMAVVRDWTDKYSAERLEIEDLMDRSKAFILQISSTRIGN